ncbi:MAG: hypothetical protein ACD_47C00562G0003 [uncultured bacterium]|nr:MAG: hypothetical protein ACD_47C00562G0003 [uncultured bacterium]
MADNFNGTNKIYTRPDGIIAGQEMRNPKSVFTQMSDPPSKENSIYSPNPIPAETIQRQPKLDRNPGGEGMVKLEKAEKYGEDSARESAAENESGGAPAEDKPAEPAAAETQTAEIKTPEMKKENEKVSAFNRGAPPVPKGMINGVPIEQILADSNLETIAQARPAEASGDTARDGEKISGGGQYDTNDGFKKVGPGLSDVGTIPRDGKANFFIVAIYPNKKMDNVKIDSTITAVFSQDLDAASVNGASFVVSGAEGKVEGKILYNQRMKKVIFRPASYLEHGVKYSVQLTTAIKSSTGQALLPLNWNFTTR